MTWFHVLLQRYISDLTSIVEHEEVENNRKFPSLLPSLSWHCTTWERADWKSHMAGDKPRAGIVCTLCLGSGTLPPHLKGSSGLAECFWGCTSSTALFAYHRCYWSCSSLLVWTAVQSIQQRLSLSHQLGAVAASGEVKISALPYRDRWKRHPGVVSYSVAFSKAELASCSSSYITASLIWL